VGVTIGGGAATKAAGITVTDTEFGTGDYHSEIWFRLVTAGVECDVDVDYSGGDFAGNNDGVAAAYKVTGADIETPVSDTGVNSGIDSATVSTQIDIPADGGAIAGSQGFTTRVGITGVDQDVSTGIGSAGMLAGYLLSESALPGRTITAEYNLARAMAISAIALTPPA
jgi:hypothetical protein